MVVNMIRGVLDIDSVRALFLSIFLVAEFISPQKVYTFGSTEEYSIPKSVKCTHSANVAVRGGGHYYAFFRKSYKRTPL